MTKFILAFLPALIYKTSVTEMPQLHTAKILTNRQLPMRGGFAKK